MKYMFTKELWAQYSLRNFKDNEAEKLPTGECLDEWTQTPLPQHCIKHLRRFYYATRTLHFLWCLSDSLAGDVPFRQISNSMANPFDVLQSAHAEDLDNANVQRPSLKKYTKVHSALSNNCDRLYEFVSSDADKISPSYLVRIYYKETKAASTTTSKDFRTAFIYKVRFAKLFRLDIYTYGDTMLLSK